MKIIKITAISLIVLWLVGCGVSPSPSTSGTGGTYLNADAVGNATISAVTHNMTIEAQQSRNAQATAVSAQATAVYQQQVTSATAEAERVRVEMTAQAAATGTTVAGTATAIYTERHDALAFQATEIALWATGTAVARSADAEATNIAAASTRQYQDALSYQNRIEREARNAAMMPYLVIILILAVSAMVIVFMWYRNQQEVRFSTPQIVNQDNRRVILLPNRDGGFAVLPGTSMSAPRSLLPAGDEDDDDLIEGEVLNTPDWELFAGWRSQKHALIGQAGDGSPIVVDRVKTPHVLVAGTTGAGKSTGAVLPYTSSMIRGGVHALLVNGRGSDFAPFTAAEHPNVTVSRKVGRDDTPPYLAAILSAMVVEIDRRDFVLDRYGVRNWAEMPARAGESGEILLVVDEFLAVIQAMKRMDSDQAGMMWESLIALTSESRKFGVYVMLTATDPTARALGNEGMTVRDQMIRMAFSMNNADASRKLLAISSASGWPSGSAGMSQGQFLANIRGRLFHGAAFHPTQQQVTDFIRSCDVPVNRLPETVLTAVEGAREVEADERPSFVAPEPVIVNQAEEDAERLDGVIEDLTSLNAVGRFLLERDTNPNGTDEMRRVKDALLWRFSEFGCPYSRQLLNRARS